MPLITRRSSTRSLPRTSFGKCGSICRHCSSFSQNRLRRIRFSAPNHYQQQKRISNRFSQQCFYWVSTLGVEVNRFGERDYLRTQQIGAAMSFLEYDGLIAPSARWKCDNLMLFCANHAITETLEFISSEEVDWRAWAKKSGIIRE